ncbi:MAG: hypothetical protein WCY36_00990 [Candidatus Omnitrophota bacterium]
MNNKKPFANWVVDEWDAFIEVWRNRRMLAIIVLVIIVGIVAYWIIDKGAMVRIISDLKAQVAKIQTENKELAVEKNLLRIENTSLKETVAPLLKQAAKEFPGEEINESLKKIVTRLNAVAPLSQPIRVATAAIEVRIKSEESLNSHFMDRGAYIAFAKEGSGFAFGTQKEIFVIMKSLDCFANQLGEGEVAYKALCNMDVGKGITEKPISHLNDANYIEVGFSPMLKKSDVDVTGGSIVCTFNSLVRAELNIPPQKMSNGVIVIRDAKISLK